MTQKVGGVGLNLTRASYVFHIEPWWNPAVENQATDRAHRLGQTKNVQVYRYIMNDSVEEKIQILKSRKSNLFNTLLTTEGSLEAHDGMLSGARISAEDFQYLVGTSAK
jgi:SNF2 family DNA or RNA helicase